MDTRRISLIEFPPRESSAQNKIPGRKELSTHRRFSLQIIKQGVRSSVEDSIKDISRIRKRLRYELDDLNDDDEIASGAKEDLSPEDIDILEDVLGKIEESEDKKINETDNSVDLESVLSNIGGYGRFQFFVHLVMIFSSTAELVSNLSTYFAGLPSPWLCVAGSTICTSNATFSSDDMTKCNMPRSEWKYLRSESESFYVQFDLSCDREWMAQLPTSTFYLGTMVGSMILGWVSDNYGRKKTLVPVYITLCTAGFLVSFSPNVWVLTGFRFIGGLCIPALSPNMGTMLSELVLPAHRSKVVVTMYIFWPFSLSLLSATSYMLPDWKKLSQVVSLPYLLLLPAIWILPESLTWLIAHGKLEDAKIALARIGNWNKKELDQEINLKMPTFALQSGQTNPCDLFCTKEMATSSLIQGLMWVAVNMAVYGILLGSADLSSGSLYLNFFYTSLAELPAVFVAYYTLDKFGRKKTMIFCSAFGSACCFGITAMPKIGIWHTGRLIAGVAGRFFACILYAGIIPWSIELYPTIIRSQGIGYVYAMGRIGCIASPWVINSMKVLHHIAPWACLAFFLALMAVSITHLPETKDRPLLTLIPRKRKTDVEVELEDLECIVNVDAL